VNGDSLSLMFFRNGVSVGLARCSNPCQTKEILMKYTIIARDNGIDRTYPCYTYAEAEFLFQALSNIARQVECWQGMTLVLKYDNM
jgi:hypothetical protein